MSEIELVGIPDGPVKFVEELGEDVPTFRKEPPRRKCLMHHVPLHKRGTFRPDQLANYDPTREYRTDPMGYLLCYAKVKDQTTGEERRCKRKAENRFPRCASHGGGLHPWDKVAEKPSQPLTEEQFQAMSRYQQYKAGFITIDDLTDEELALQGFRAKNGKIYQPKKLDRELALAFNRALFDRASQELRNGTVKAATTLVKMVEDPNLDAALRLKAATEILDRNLGKAANVVTVTHQAPWEEMFEAIQGGKRRDARIQRGDPPGVDPRDVPMDVEVVDETPSEQVHYEHNGLLEAGLTEVDIDEVNPQVNPPTDALLVQTVTIEPPQFTEDDF